MSARRVLFLCTGNSARSQMADGLARAFAPDWEAYSAGTLPAGIVHPLAIEVMAEIGVDISEQHSKSVNEFRDVPMDLVITVCGNAAANCPLWLGQGRVVHRAMPDPVITRGDRHQQLEAFRAVRDTLFHQVVSHLDELLAAPAEDTLGDRPGGVAVRLTLELR